MNGINRMQMMEPIIYLALQVQIQDYSKLILVLWEGIGTTHLQTLTTLLQVLRITGPGEMERWNIQL